MRAVKQVREELSPEHFHHARARVALASADAIHYATPVLFFFLLRSLKAAMDCSPAVANESGARLHMRNT